jgi:hypothetical protein
MKRVLCAAALLALPLAAAGPAAAKEIKSAKVCGANGCNEVKEKKSLAFLAEGGDPTDPPDHPSAWFRATLTVGDEEHSDSWSVAVLPALRMVRSYDESRNQYVWMPISAESAKAYTRAAGGLKPFPASKLRGLEQRLPEAHVVETFDPAGSAADDDGSFPYWLAALGAVLLGAGGFVLVRRGAGRARERRMEPGAPSPGAASPEPRG